MDRRIIFVALMEAANPRIRRFTFLCCFIKTIGFHFASCLARSPRLQRQCQVLKKEGFRVFVHTDQPDPTAEELAHTLGLPTAAVLVADCPALYERLSQPGCRAYFSGDADTVAALNARLLRPMACYVAS